MGRAQSDVDQRPASWMLASTSLNARIVSGLRGVCTTGSGDNGIPRGEAAQKEERVLVEHNRVRKVNPQWQLAPLESGAAHPLQPLEVESCQDSVNGHVIIAVRDRHADSCHDASHAARFTLDRCGGSLRDALDGVAGSREAVGGSTGSGQVRRARRDAPRCDRRNTAVDPDRITSKGLTVPRTTGT